MTYTLHALTPPMWEIRQGDRTVAVVPREDDARAILAGLNALVGCENCDKLIDPDNPDECTSRPEGYFCRACTTHPWMKSVDDLAAEACGVREEER